MNYMYDHLSPDFQCIEPPPPLLKKKNPGYDPELYYKKEYNVHLVRLTFRLQR